MAIARAAPLRAVQASTYRDVRDVLTRHQRFVLTTHRDPDGDGLGAEAALREALLQLGKDVRVLNDGSVPPPYRFLHGSDAFEVYRPNAHNDVIAAADAVVLVDAARGERTGRLAPALARFDGVTVAIDHHLLNGWARIDLIDPDACSSTTIVYELFQGMSVEITPTIADALYCGLVVDTHNFRTGHTTPAAHRLAAELLEAGASQTRVNESLSASWPIGRLRLLSHFLGGLRAQAGGRMVWGVLDQRALRRWRQTSAAIEGFVEEALNVAGTDLAILFLEERDAVRISLRSRGSVTVDRVARRLGGGGHARAAGARIPGRLKDAVRRVLREARTALT